MRESTKEKTMKEPKTKITMTVKDYGFRIGDLVRDINSFQYKEKGPQLVIGYTLYSNAFQENRNVSYERQVSRIMKRKKDSELESCSPFLNLKLLSVRAGHKMIIELQQYGL